MYRVNKYEMANTQQNTQKNTFKISQLSNITQLDDNDLFLVSDHTDNKFHTRKLSASTLFSEIQRRVITYIVSNEAFLSSLALEIVNSSGNQIVNSIAPMLSSQVINQATPIVKDNATPLVSAEALPIVSSEAVALVSTETIPMISSELLELTINDIINNEELSTAITNTDTAIGYGVYSAVSSQVDDAINDAIGDDVAQDVVNIISANNYLSTCVVTTIANNQEVVWDILTDGKNDGVSEINAGGAS